MTTLHLPSDLSSDEDSISDITCNICAKMPCCLIRDKIEIDNCFEVGDKFEGPNNEKRYHYYDTFVKIFYNRSLGKNNRIELPACFESAVKNRYPEDDVSNYVGFKTFAEKHKRKKRNPVILDGLKKI